jgi:hypothetical protein
MRVWRVEYRAIEAYAASFQNTWKRLRGEKTNEGYGGDEVDMGYAGSRQSRDRCLLEGLAVVHCRWATWMEKEINAHN